MQRSRYYTPSTPPMYTYALTAFAAVVVFSAVIYLNFFHKPPQARLLSSSRFPPDYPVLNAATLYDEGGRAHRLAGGQCGMALLSLLPDTCDQRIESQRLIYGELRELLNSSGLAPPPLFLIDPRIREERDGGAEAAEAGKPACLDCRAGECAPLASGSWPAVSGIYQHFNEPISLSGPGPSQCAEPKPSSWILIDGLGKPKLYIHKKQSVRDLARDYLRIVNETALADSDGR